MSVQAPLIYAYPLKDWIETYRMFHRTDLIRMTVGQIESLRAVGSWMRSFPCSDASTAVRAIF